MSKKSTFTFVKTESVIFWSADNETITGTPNWLVLKDVWHITMIYQLHMYIQYEKDASVNMKSCRNESIWYFFSNKWKPLYTIVLYKSTLLICVKNCVILLTGHIQ